MVTKSLSLKARSGDLIQFSTAKPAHVPLVFADEQSAISLLQSLFAVSDLPGDSIVSVYAWFNPSAAGVTMWSQARAGALRQTLAKALVDKTLFACILPAQPAEIPAAPAKAPKSGAQPKAANPGGRAEQQAEVEPGVNSNRGENAAGNQEPANKDKETCGDPVAMCSGEEILELTDFSLEGPLPLHWVRSYRSSQSAENIGLGFGWRSNFHLQIDLLADAEEEPLLWLTDEEGRRLPFAQVAAGQTSYQLAEGLALRHEANGSLVLLRPDDTHWVFVPSADKSARRRWVLHQILDNLGHTLQLFYDRLHRLSRIDYSAGRGIELSYSAKGQLSQIEAVRHSDEGMIRLGKVLARYDYDAAGDLCAATNLSQQLERYQYAGHLLTERERASGFRHYFSWDGDGPGARCSRNWGDDGCYDYRFEYRDAERLSLSTDSRGQCWRYYHDEQNRLIKKVAPDGASWQYQWNDQGKKVAEIDPLGATTRFEFNRRGQLSHIIAADAGVTQFHYNALGQRSGIIDAEGQEWRREYTSAGLLKAEISPDGARVRYEYNSLNQLSCITAADGSSTHFAWDTEGQLLARRAPTGLTRYSYDELGRLNGLVDAAGLVTEYRRNEAGQLIGQRQYPQDAPEQVLEQSFDYDSAGRLISKTNALGQERQWQYDGLRQPTKQWQPDGSSLGYQYDSERNLTAIMRSDGARYQLDYDDRERPVKLQGFDGRVQQYEYDANGKVVGLEDGSQRQIRVVRDALGRVIEQKALCLGAANRQLSSQHFHYDKLGRLLRANNGQRKLRFGHHANGRVKSLWQDNWHIEHKYDAAGRKTATLLPDGSQLDYRYNDQGQVSQLGLNQQPILLRRFDNAGRESEREYASGMVMSQQFDAFNRLSGQQWQHGSELHERHYHYSALHQLLTVEDTRQGKVNYQYDSLDQLVSKRHETDPSQNEHHSWDSFGNPVGDDIQLQQDKLQRYLGRHYSYDDSGNQLSVKMASGQQKREFNGLNQLVSLSNGTDISRYEYDALGRRSAKITAAGRIDYLWDGNQLIGEHSQDAFSWYLYEPDNGDGRGNRPLALLRNGELFFYQLDQLGTPLALVDKENNIVWQANYSVFGQASVSINEIANPLRFQGQYYDEESGLHYNHFRYYDPQSGRFISQDPIGLLGGINHYQYAPNHINWVDPLGLSCKEDAQMDAQPVGTPYKLDANGRWHDKTGKFCAFSWPSHDGFATSFGKALADSVTLAPGTKLDRYGGYFGANGEFKDTGRYFADEGIEFEKRALPPKSKAFSPHTFEVIESFDVLSGPIAPWFGEPGGGTQYFVPEEYGGVDGLIASGKIKRTSEIPRK
ncbi:glycohydrolase toxin TNT-related protein [Shewanella sp. AS16]|uniref:RHS repeat-associated core domain-containing protein n=1 Tax=Shewanella sp. AS16 TaxID=2907625 RepID=UPI001F19E10B|nr:RHS repeat-associated core domain-containing protein [Shewanella sp. AS16]MCE9687211.1 glycohydrolase toxin TNT-related protein [Shewanella sp. AS16]